MRASKENMIFDMCISEDHKPLFMVSLRDMQLKCSITIFKFSKGERGDAKRQQEAHTRNSIEDGITEIVESNLLTAINRLEAYYNKARNLLCISYLTELAIELASGIYSILESIIYY